MIAAIKDLEGPSEEAAATYFFSVTKRFALKRALKYKFRLSLVKVSLWQDF